MQCKSVSDLATLTSVSWHKQQHFNMRMLEGEHVPLSISTNIPQTVVSYRLVETPYEHQLTFTFYWMSVPPVPRSSLVAHFHNFPFVTALFNHRFYVFWLQSGADITVLSFVPGTCSLMMMSLTRETGAVLGYSHIYIHYYSSAVCAMHTETDCPVYHSAIMRELSGSW